MHYDPSADAEGLEIDRANISGKSTRWYPKLTPCRLLNLNVGIGLGVAKAALTYGGSELVPVALEWVLGTVLFLVFYVLSLLEQDHRLNGIRYSWFYDYDCLSIIWALMRRFNIDPPTTSTSEIAPRDPDSLQRTMNNYHLLVSACVLSFGTLKAILAYTGQSDGATAVDWIFGVVIMTGLYILGLYEFNDMKLLPFLFARNDSQSVFSAGYEGCILSSVVLLVYLFILGIQFSWKTATLAYNQRPDPINLKSKGGIISLCTDILVYDLLAWFAYVCLTPLVTAIYVARRYFKPSGVVTRFTAIFLRKTRLARFVRRQTTHNRIPSNNEWGYIFLRYANHVFLHTFALIFFGTGSFLFLFLGIDYIPSNLVMAPIMILFGLPCAVFILPITKSLARPFYRMRQLESWRSHGNNLGLII
ncbi:hypothetical protein BJ165DRAFT_1606005 [Panaeolus papilionaceus]|nr:hypothetical protein BJ165DRAFT_1606005 [Panaeolus papilionaceus]